MEKIYGSPFRVYLLFALLLGVGILSYINMPVALFPNSTKPEIYVNVQYEGKWTRESFLNTHGKGIEYLLKAVQTKSCTSEKVIAHYGYGHVQYKIQFSWGDDGQLCLKEIEQIISSYKSRFPEEVQRATYVWLNNNGTGFFFANFHSETRSSKEIYEIIEPILQPKLSAIREANDPGVGEPVRTEITIELDPFRMASLKLLPRDVISKVQDRLRTYNGGSLDQEGHQISIELSSNIVDVESLSKILVSSDSKTNVFLSEIAQISLGPSTQNRQIIKVNGSTAVTLWEVPAPGKNIKDMSDKIIAAVKETMSTPGFPSDIQFNVAVNPSEFIDAAISNVMGEVWLCSLIAVLVLFFFIGSFVGTLTALIEIPMSIILSFILMKLTNVQLNLVSLGGLALSVGMNVDASIVVIDSIIKRFASQAGKVFNKELIIRQVADAVREVASPVIVSTITSLIVFIPLVFTSDLSYAILGDLAKAVIYSHGLSLFIAMILVPTVRIHIAQVTGSFAEHHSIAFIDRFLEGIYDGYCRTLEIFLQKNLLKKITYALVFVALLVVCWVIPPHLKREIIAKPESPIIFADITASTNVHMTQMEETVAKFERRVLDKVGSSIAFSESGTNSPTSAWVALHLHDKRKFKAILQDLQDMTKEDTDARYFYEPYNASELPIPNPPDWKVEFRGDDIVEQAGMKESFRLALLDSGIVQDVQEKKDGVFDNKLMLKLDEDKLDLLSASRIQVSDLAQIVSLTSSPVFLGDLPLKPRIKKIYLKYPQNFSNSVEEIGALPVPIGDKVIPLRSLGEMKTSKEPSGYNRIDSETVFGLEGYLLEKEKASEREILSNFKNFVTDFIEKNSTSKIRIEQVDAKVELTKALKELLLAISISIGLIFLVIFLQFSSVVHSLIIMLAIPFGILGVFLSLFIFNSTLSLNSGLGVILLVGITVANSIMLVEMIVRLVHKGVDIHDAIMQTARKRIRPIVMTSLTTILGMLPIALGHGDGGTVLQPLGISVCGGLWMSLIFTLYIIPSLELSYLKSLKKKRSL